MNKNAIKKFAIDARNKLIASVTDKAGMLGITPNNCSEAITKGADFEVYKTAAGTEVTLNKKQCEQRRKLVDQIHARGFEAVVEEVAYTWFNRICAIRFMEVNDYMYPVRVRVLSSEKEGKNEPDVVTMAPDIDWDFTDKEREEIIDAKMNNRLDDLFRMLFIKQCNLLHEVLPGLFEETEDYTEMLLNISFTNEDDVIRMLVDGIDEKDFNITSVDEDGKVAGQVEIIGWLYQYYNTEPKNKAFAKKTKITKEEVPAVTQLFTPDWIVRYMVENSLGRMWVEGHPDEELKSKWKYYLDEAEQEEFVQHELDKIKAEYATLKPEDIKLIDPCMGSGHILVYAFDVFMQIYENAGWSQRDAAQSIIQNNIYGLDIDDRAAQLSYFAVLMKARQYDRRILTRGIEPNVYAVQESNGINRGQLKYFGTGLTDTEKNVAVSQMEGLLNTLNDAKEYGSLLNVEDYDWELLEKFVENTDTESQISFDTYGLDETAEQLKRLIRIGKVMAQKYEIVATNPPYAGTSNLSAKMNNFVKKNYPDSKADLFAVFIERCGEILKKNGYQAMITQHSWMFLTSYEKLRMKLQQKTIINMAHLGARAFEEIAGEVVQTASFVLSKRKINNYIASCSRLVEASSQSKKEELYLQKKEIYYSRQENYEKIQGAPIAYWVSENIINAFDADKLLKDVVTASVGIQTGDNEKFIHLWWEIKKENINYGAMSIEDSYQDKKWFPYNKGGEYRKWYGNDATVIDWKNDGEDIIRNSQITGHHYQQYAEELKFKPLVTWSRISTGAPAFRIKKYGYLSDMAGFSMFSSIIDLKFIVAFCNSVVAKKFLEFLAPTLNYMIGPVTSMPIKSFDKNKEGILNEVNSAIKISKEDWDSFETSWDFQHHPLLRNVPTIAEAFDQWQTECDDRFNQLKSNEEELNRIFIDIYGLQDELTPEVEDKDVTVRKADLGRDIRSFISYAVGCMFGRYSLDVDGLAYAGGEWDASKCVSFAVDKDNIIPICDDEYFEDDIVGLFVEFVKTVYGADMLDENLKFIADALGGKGQPKDVIRNYFLSDFYSDHCKMYQKRPIYWLFDSGKKNGFKALIYMHRYQPDTIARIRTDYVHEQQARYRTALADLEQRIFNGGCGVRVILNKKLTTLQAQDTEIRTYEEKIHHLADQMISIDLDDGVKKNYAIFQDVLAKIK